MPLEEGHCYEIKDFSLTATLELTRVSRNKLHIKLSKSSVISKIPPIPASNFYCFANFINLYRGLSHPKFSVGTFYVLSYFLSRKLPQKIILSILCFIWSLIIYTNGTQMFMVL